MSVLLCPCWEVYERYAQLSSVSEKQYFSIECCSTRLSYVMDSVTTQGRIDNVPYVHGWHDIVGPDGIQPRP